MAATRRAGEGFEVADARLRTPAEPQVAVLVPCYNEAATIAAVLAGFKEALPGARIVVYDNNSKDDTAQIARHLGAEVRHEPAQGKGYVVRRMLADIDADCYVMVDGDATYDPRTAPLMIHRLFAEELDLVNGRRVATGETAYRYGHRLGNRLLTGLIRWLFGQGVDDVFSGYKVFSRRFAKSCPAMSKGFEVETELVVHALSLGLPITEVDTPYGARPAGSTSKLRTVHDGVRILGTIVGLFKEERPLAFFGILGAALAAVSVGLSVPLFVEYADTGLVPRFPTAILATGVMISALISAACGVVLESVKRGQREIKRLFYLHPRP